MPKLGRLYLNGNKLTHFGDVRSLHISTINLSSNPLHCGEELSWMGEEDLGFERGLTCATPACLHGMAIADMSNSIQCGTDITRLFFLNPYNRRSIARPWGRGMECVLWVEALILCSALLTVVMYAIWCYVGPRYNGTRTFFQTVYFYSI